MNARTKLNSANLLGCLLLAALAGGLTRNTTVFVFAAIVLIVVIVVLQNTQAVETNLLFLTVTMPNAALMFGTLIVGFAVGVLAAGHMAPTAKHGTTK